MQESTVAPSRRGGTRPGAGRPRRAPTLSAALREAFPIDRLVAIAEDMIGAESDEVRFRTMVQIWERAHGKVSDKLELGPPGSLDEADEDVIAEMLTDAELDELDRLDEQRAKVLERARDRDGSLLLPAASGAADR